MIDLLTQLLLINITVWVLIGGLAVGESQKEMFETVKNITDKMPANKPRYLMGVGTPSDILGAVKEGVDQIITESGLDPLSILKGITRFSNERDKRLELIKKEIPNY